MEYDHQFTHSPGHAEELAKRALEAGCKRILVAGGDGTVMEAVAALAETDAVLGLVPVGTGNQLAANLRIPSKIEAAVVVAATGEARRIDVGMIDGRPFTCMAGAGFDTAVINPDPRLKRYFGYLSYVIAAIAETLAPTAADIVITIDGVKKNYRGIGIEIANMPGLRPPGSPWPINLVNDGRFDDGMLDICILGATSMVTTISVLLSFIMQRADRNPHIHYLKGREIKIESDPPLPVQADGELFGATPFSVSIRPRALSVAVPEARDGVKI